MKLSRKLIYAIGVMPQPTTVFLLVIINAFVGGMVGLERTILPLMQRAVVFEQ